jgi:L-ribulokinase
VRDSVVPGYLGFEAGQAAVGDLFDWFVKNMCGQQSHEKLFEEAGKIRPGTSGLLALDWNNGNRCVLADPRLTGLMVGQTLSTTPPEVLRALIEASAFGALMIIERMEQYGAKIDTIVACGGIAEKSPFILQILADVTGRQIAASRSNQSCALGSAIFGAVAGGAHSSVPAAQRAMAGLKDKVYVPDSRSAKVYGRLFACYKALHDAFGRPDKSISLGWVMKELLILRDLTRSVT